jgi:2-oxoisovalerate dehydrogenase E1 component
LTGGIGAEIAAFIAEHAFEDLDAPVTRVASLDTPVPFVSEIESKIYLPIERLQEALKGLLEY